MRYIIFIILGIPFLSFSQTAGNVVFGTDQVIEARFTFNQVGYWDSLVANYPSETDMICASLDITDNTGLHHFDNISIRLKGNSSYGHPGNKKSFKIDFNDVVSTQKYDGMKKLNFNNGFNDPTFMRDKIYMDVSRAAGVPAPRINYVNVYFNNTFWGFYTIVEQVDKEFIQNNFTFDNGNLFKAGDAFGSNPVFADLKYYGTDPALYVPNRYELKTNETLNDVTDLIDLLNFINNSTNTDFGTNLSQHFNQTNLLKSIATDILFSNLDSYQNSARNYYIYHDSLNSRWEWIKWDANEAFGSYTGGPGLSNMEQLAINYVATNRPLISNIFANSSLYIQYQQELCKIMSLYFNNAYIDPKIDALKTLIEAHVTADNLKQFTLTQFNTNINSNITVSGGPMPGGKTYYGLKSFITNRTNYINGVIDCVALSVDELDAANLLLYPNPIQNSLTIKGLKTNDIQLFDAFGKQVLFSNQSINSMNELVLDLGHLNTGIYFLQSGGRAFKFVKE